MQNQKEQIAGFPLNGLSMKRALLRPRALHLVAKERRNGRDPWPGRSGTSSAVNQVRNHRLAGSIQLSTVGGNPRIRLRPSAAVDPQTPGELRRPAAGGACTDSRRWMMVAIKLCNGSPDRQTAAYCSATPAKPGTQGVAITCIFSRGKRSSGPKRLTPPRRGSRPRTINGIANLEAEVSDTSSKSLPTKANALGIHGAIFKINVPPDHIWSHRKLRSFKLGKHSMDIRVWRGTQAFVESISQRLHGVAPRAVLRPPAAHAAA